MLRMRLMVLRWVLRRVLLLLLLLRLLVVLVVEAEAEHGAEERRVDGRRGRRGRQGRHRVLEPRVGVDPPSCDRARELRMALSDAAPEPRRRCTRANRGACGVEREDTARTPKQRSVGWLVRSPLPRKQKSTKRIDARSLIVRGALCVRGGGGG